MSINLLDAALKHKAIAQMLAVAWKMRLQSYTGNLLITSITMNLANKLTLGYFRTTPP